MAAPGLTFTVSGHQISDEAGFDFITVTFRADMAYQAFECRVTKLGEDYGVGKGPGGLLLPDSGRYAADIRGVR